MIPNRPSVFSSESPFEPSEDERNVQRLAAMPVTQPSENGTPFELCGTSQKHCDSKQKAHRRKRRWALLESQWRVQSH
ncbi:hypothetical protein N9153_02145 [Planctomicrobium sp.]|nr:hypothetical protein [Planctomicrobium sp.]